MRGPASAVVVLLGLVLTVLTLLLLAGHGPWAGRTVIAFGPRHGLNSGDVPVLFLWAAGMGCCAYLLFRRG